MCDKLRFPNIYALLQLVCTLPVTSCECERSNSVLRRLHNYLRASTGEERLSNLAVLHINYDFKYDYDLLVDLYSRKHARKLQFENIVK